jgi:hypothetical protein
MSCGGVVAFRRDRPMGKAELLGDSSVLNGWSLLAKHYRRTGGERAFAIPSILRQYCRNRTLQDLGLSKSRLNHSRNIITDYSICGIQDVVLLNLSRYGTCWSFAGSFCTRFIEIDEELECLTAWGLTMIWVIHSYTNKGYHTCDCKQPYSLWFQNSWRLRHSSCGWKLLTF